ncbi:MAG: hypothetical protein IPN88_04540 [Bacteroidetes bacterium]|nr:hypothetical protein [Bacteroidota bacterium]
MNNGAVAQNFDGALTANNKLGNVTITKSGVASTTVDMDIAGNFTTSNAGSVFNTNNKYIKVAGNFTNAAGNSTFTNVIPGGYLEFNGAAAQTYSPGGILTLENVVMNNSGAGVNLVGSDMLIGPTGTLDLTLGKLITSPALKLLFKILIRSQSSTTIHLVLFREIFNASYPALPRVMIFLLAIH